MDWERVEGELIIVFTILGLLGIVQIANWSAGIQLNEDLWNCTAYSNPKDSIIGDEKYQTCDQYTRKTKRVAP